LPVSGAPKWRSEPVCRVSAAAQAIGHVLRMYLGATFVLRQRES